MANENETTGADNEAAKERRIARMKGKVIDYDQADDELKALMEKYMEQIDKAPNSFDAIINYGNPPLKKLGDLGNEMIRIQGRFNEQVNVMGNALDQLQNGMQGMNLEKLGENARKLLLSIADTTVKGAKGAGNLISRFFKSVSGKNKKKTTDEEKLIKEMQDALPEMLKEMLKLMHTIEETDKGLIQVMAEATKLGMARVECTRDISIYLGAGKEVLRRYKEEYIPEARKQAEETADPEDQMYLEEVVKCQTRFINRLTILEGSRAQSVIQAQQLKQIIETMEDQREKNQDIIHNGQNEWKAMLATAGIAGSSLKAAQNQKAADEFGDKIHDQTMIMIEETQKMTLNSIGRGTIDPAKMIDGMNRLMQMLEKKAEADKNRLVALDATAKSLRSTTDKLIEAADESNTKRLLEAAPDVAEEKKESKPSNDNSSAKPEKKTGTDNTPNP
jgi:uncharacterized protein YaaN involved in tellurite resistance